MYIYYSKKETKNLGNYENIVIKLGIKDRVEFEKETPDECYERLKNFTDKKLRLELQYIELLGRVKDEIKRLIKISSVNKSIIQKLIVAFKVNKIQDLDLISLQALNDKLNNNKSIIRE